MAIVQGKMQRLSRKMRHRTGHRIRSVPVTVGAQKPVGDMFDSIRTLHTEVVKLGIQMNLQFGGQCQRPRGPTKIPWVRAFSQRCIIQKKRDVMTPERFESYNGEWMVVRREVS